MTVIKATRKN